MSTHVYISHEWDFVTMNALLLRKSWEIQDVNKNIHFLFWVFLIKIRLIRSRNIKFWSYFFYHGFCQMNLKNCKITVIYKLWKSDGAIWYEIFVVKILTTSSTATGTNVLNLQMKSFRLGNVEFIAERLLKTVVEIMCQVGSSHSL